MNCFLIVFINNYKVKRNHFGKRMALVNLNRLHVKSVEKTLKRWAVFWPLLLQNGNSKFVHKNWNIIWISFLTKRISRNLNLKIENNLQPRAKRFCLFTLNTFTHWIFYIEFFNKNAKFFFPRRLRFYTFRVVSLTHSLWNYARKFF